MIGPCLALPYNLAFIEYILLDLIVFGYNNLAIVIPPSDGSDGGHEIRYSPLTAHGNLLQVC